MISKASALPSIHTYKRQTISEFSEGPTSSTDAFTFPGSTNTGNTLLQDERTGWLGKRGCAPVGDLGMGMSPLQGGAGGTGPVVRWWRRRQREGYAQGRNCRDVKKTAEQRAVAQRAHKMHTRSPNAWKTHLTKLIYMCSFPLCSSTFNQVILFHPLQNAM